MSRAASLVSILLALALAGCGGTVPVPTLPQLQEVGEIGEYGTARLSATDACRRKSATVDAYVSCMEQAGWAFIARSGEYPAPECWSRRAAGDPGDLPPALCFHRSAAGAPAQ